MSQTVTKHDLSKIFNALGDQNRFKIVKILGSDEKMCVSEVAKEIGITTAGVSQHMKILEQAGVVKPHRLGQKICYQINKEDANVSSVMSLI